MTTDSVYALASELKTSEEYTAFCSAKEKAFADETNAALIKQYQKATTQAQIYAAAGQNPPEELAQQQQRIFSVLQHNPDCMNYLLAEYKFHALIGDVFRILSEAVDIKLDFLRD